MTWSAGLLAILALVLANAFFVATEFAIVAVRRSRLEELAKQGSRKARAAQNVVTHLDAYIAACQFGITLASLGLGWIGEPVLAGMLEPLLATVIPEEWATVTAHGVAIPIAFAFITALHIVVGELAPKGIALQKPEPTSLWVAIPIQLFYAVFRWPINVLNWIGNGSLRLLGFKATAGHENVHSVEELRYLVNISQEAGVVEESEARIASRAFQFAELTARELMTPRTHLKALSVTLPAEAVFQEVSAAGHARLPVFENTLDEVIGILNVRDLFSVAARAEPVVLRDLVRPALSVPVSRRADDILEDLRTSGARMAVVIDEFGGTAGVLTSHDLLEWLVGRLRAAGSVIEIGPVEADGSRAITGSASLREVTEATGLKFSEEDNAQADTLTGVLMSRLGRLPAVGDSTDINGHSLTVESMESKRSPRLRLRPRR